MLLFSFKERITGSPEPFPNLFRLFVMNRTDFFPALLQGNQLFCSLLPFVAVLEGFSLNTKINFQLQVVALFFLKYAVVFTFTVEESITGFPETLVYFSIILFWCKADGFPNFLKFYQLIGTRS